MTERIFIPGSSWLYFKLYTGQKSADELLISYLYPLVKKLKEQGDIEDFFFIRYSDPNFHLRIRFYIADKTHYGVVFNTFYETFEPCVRNRLVSRVQCDTYQRELERYGNNSTETAERIFCIDSYCILELLRTFTDTYPDPDNDRWLVSCQLIDDLLEAFSFDTSRKIELLSRMAEDFKQEFGFVNKTVTKQLNNKYRLYRQQIPGSFRNYPQIEQCFTIRKELLTVQARHLMEMESRKVLTLPLPDIVYSLLHMTMNRWFRSKNRIYELVIYEFLRRHYDSVLAQSGYNRSSSVESI